MTRLLLGSILLILVTGPTSAPRLTGTCGITPIKPIPPIGCKDVYATCVCDADGDNCHWIWNCVP